MSVTPVRRTEMTRNEAIVTRYKAGERARDLAREYGLSRGYVHQIIEKHRIMETRVHPYEIGRLGLSTRVVNCLCQEGITTLAQLREYTAKDLAKIPNMGKISIAELVQRELVADVRVPSAQVQHERGRLRSVLLRSYMALRSGADDVIPDVLDDMRRTLRAIGEDVP